MSESTEPTLDLAVLVKERAGIGLEARVPLEAAP
jgi:hypothetical protein